MNMGIDVKTLLKRHQESVSAVYIEEKCRNVINDLVQILQIIEEQNGDNAVCLSMIHREVESALYDALKIIATTSVDYLTQSNVNVVSTFVDYYRVKEWPGKNSILPNSAPEQIAETMNTAAKTEICQEYDCLNPTQRFIPFIAVHEFETLLFSDTKALADGLGVAQTTIDADISRFSTPEHINNSPLTAPSKRLERWYPQYGKTTTGIAIAKTIPVDTMRAKCPLFNQWLSAIEAVAGV